MFCVVCQNDVGSCTCPDIDERLASIGNNSNFVFPVCIKCQKHYGRCKCKNPSIAWSDKLSKSNWWERIVDRFKGNN